MDGNIDGTLPNRRELLRRAGAGFGSLALAALLADDPAADELSAVPLAPRAPHSPASRSRVRSARSRARKACSASTR